MISDNSAFALPHRRPTFLLNTPCLVSHYCLRPKRDNDPVHRNEDAPERLDADSRFGANIVDPINNYLQAVAAKVRGDAPRFTTEPAQNTPRRSRKKIVHASSTLGWRLPVLELGGLVDVDITVDIHTEYSTICIHAFPRVTASWKGAPYCPDDRPLADMLCWLTEAHGADVANDDVGDRVIKEFYEVFWERLFKIFDPPDHPNAGLGADCFAMFRGVVIRNTSVESQLQLSAPDDRHDKDWSPLYGPKLVKETYEEGGTPRDMTKPNEVQKDLIAFANRKSRFFTRLLHFRQGVSWIDDYLGGNAILCAPLDGLALYGSTMGAERLDREGDETNLVRYFIIYGGPSRNQLGRLVRRLHTAGECRIAALFDFDIIRDAGRRLRDLDMDSSVEAHPDEQTLTNWSATLTSAARAGRGGLMNRQSQAEHYGAVLSQRVAELRLTRIVGWQTYAEFITRQVGPNLATIDRIGRRFRDLDSRLRRRSNEQLAGQFQELAKKISTTNDAIAGGNKRIEQFNLTAQIVGAGLLACALNELMGPFVEALAHRYNVDLGKLSEVQYASITLSAAGLVAGLTIFIASLVIQRGTALLARLTGR